MKANRVKLVEYSDPDEKVQKKRVTKKIKKHDKNDCAICQLDIDSRLRVEQRILSYYSEEEVADLMSLPQEDITSHCIAWLGLDLERTKNSENYYVGLLARKAPSTMEMAGVEQLLSAAKQLDVIRGKTKQSESSINEEKQQRQEFIDQIKAEYESGTPAEMILETVGAGLNNEEREYIGLCKTETSSQ